MTTTIQLTSKPLKAASAVTACMAIAGGAMAVLPTETGILGGGLLVIGVVSHIVVRGLIWWKHG